MHRTGSLGQGAFSVHHSIKTQSMHSPWGAPVPTRVGVTSLCHSECTDTTGRVEAQAGMGPSPYPGPDPAVILKLF